MNFIDLQEQYRRYRDEITREIQPVLDSAQFILGPAVAELEKALAAHTGVPHAIACSSGTDALLLCLMAKGIGPGDEVIVPDFTFFATAEVVSFLGATPVFVDVQQDTFNLDPLLAERRISGKTKGIIAVSLFGQCADMDEISALAKARGLWVLEDAAQSYGALYKGKRSGSLTEFAATSFFPAKPLGCYGDGGAVFTTDGALSKEIQVLLSHGQSARYTHTRIGMNGRLDTLQAAVLKVKLRHFDGEMAQKRLIAKMYQSRLQRHVTVPSVRDYNESVWAQFTVRSAKRDHIIEALKVKGIPTAVHYPIPLHRQPVFSGMHLRDSDFPVSTQVSAEVFSLPMHPFLSEADVGLICGAIAEAAK